MGVFKFEQGVESPEVWLFSDQCYKLDLTYQKYVECLFETRGFFDWQYLFADVSLDDLNTGMVEYLTEMLTVLPKLFPNTDFTKYVERFEKLKSRSEN
jgi:hypothetical protein